MIKKIRRRSVAMLSIGLMMGSILYFVGCENNAGSGSSVDNVGSMDFTDDSFKYQDTFATNWEYANKSAKSGDKSLNFLSKEAIKDRLKQTAPSLVPSDANALMEQAVGYTVPYSEGKVKSGVLRLAQERLNTFRRIAGLPAVTLDQNLTDSAQKGAALIAITNTGGHGAQPKPEGMEDSFYNEGKAATAKCNLATSARPIEIVAEFIDDFGGTQNPHANAKVGHRMKSLDPRLSKVGFGLAPSKPEGGLGAFLMNYNSLPGAKHPEMGDWDFVAWPAPGYFPLNASVFDLHQNLFPRWSVVFNNSKYTFGKGYPDKSEVIISCVKGSAEGKSWTYKGADNPSNMYINTSEIVDADGQYPPKPYTTYVFYIDDNTHRYKDGDVYNIQIKNNNGDTIANYYTEFFDSKQ